jgi:hypothetical protein
MRGLSGQMSLLASWAMMDLETTLVSSQAYPVVTMSRLNQLLIVM